MQENPKDNLEFQYFLMISHTVTCKAALISLHSLSFITFTAYLTVMVPMAITQRQQLLTEVTGYGAEMNVSKRQENQSISIPSFLGLLITEQLFTTITISQSCFN